MPPLEATGEEGDAVPMPSFGEAVSTWARIGVLSFGGPTAQIALMHRIIVGEKRWLSERQYLNALSFCMLLPGPEAMQLATYAGWRLHGLRGGLAAGLLFVLPGALVVLALAMTYASFGKLPLVEAIFYGIKAAVVVIVVEALIRISKRALTLKSHWLIAAASFIAIFFLKAPFPLIIAIAAGIGILMSSRDRSPASPAARPAVSLPGTLTTIAAWAAVWVVPLMALVLLLGPRHVVSELSLFFSKLAMVTFGGAYAVLAYMAQDVVTHYGWLEAGQMMDGLGLAETTPGPLILVTEFVGYVAAFRQGGEAAVGIGLLGAFVALWATFAPCFLWIFAGAPYIEWIIAQPRLRGALTAIMAAVVGVILNLALWFALHVFFAEVTFERHGPVALWRPEIASLDWRIVGLALVSGYLLLWKHWGIASVLALSAALAVALKLAPV
jgi:chromate transporter